MVDPKVIELTRAKSSRGKNKWLNISNIYNNIESSIFKDVYFHYFNKPKITEESIAERTKLRRQRLNIIEKNKKNINNKLFKEYFNYSNPDTMIKRLKDVGDEKNKNMVESINKKLNKTKKISKKVPENKTFKIEESEKNNWYCWKDSWA